MRDAHHSESYGFTILAQFNFGEADLRTSARWSQSPPSGLEGGVEYAEAAFGGSVFLAVGRREGSRPPGLQSEKSPGAVT